MVKRQKNITESQVISELAIKGIQDKKGFDIVCLDLRKIPNAVSDFFVICHGNSTTQVGAIADSVDDEVKKATGLNPWRKEGFANAEWILIDYIDVVVHIFQEQTRQFYKLEELWADAEITRL